MPGGDVRERIAAGVLQRREARLGRVSEGGFYRRLAHLRERARVPLRRAECPKIYRLRGCARGAEERPFLGAHAEGSLCGGFLSAPGNLVCSPGLTSAPASSIQLLI